MHESRNGFNRGSSLIPDNIDDGCGGHVNDAFAFQASGSTGRAAGDLDVFDKAIDGLAGNDLHVFVENDQNGSKVVSEDNNEIAGAAAVADKLNSAASERVEENRLAFKAGHAVHVVNIDKVSVGSGTVAILVDGGKVCIVKVSLVFGLIFGIRLRGAKEFGILNDGLTFVDVQALYFFILNNEASRLAAPGHPDGEDTVASANASAFNDIQDTTRVGVDDEDAAIIE